MPLQGCTWLSSKLVALHQASVAKQCLLIPVNVHWSVPCGFALRWDAELVAIHWALSSSKPDESCDTS